MKCSTTARLFGKENTKKRPPKKWYVFDPGYVSNFFTAFYFYVFLNDAVLNNVIPTHNVLGGFHSSCWWVCIQDIIITISSHGRRLMPNRTAGFVSGVDVFSNKVMEQLRLKVCLTKIHLDGLKGCCVLSQWATLKDTYESVHSEELESPLMGLLMARKKGFCLLSWTYLNFHMTVVQIFICLFLSYCGCHGNWGSRWHQGAEKLSRNSYPAACA